jgi:hypothetical protein
MKQRIRWFDLEASQVVLSGLPRRMMAAEYDEETGDGFRIEAARRGEAVGSYIEKVESVEEIEDPFGKVLKFRRVTYQRVRFRLGASRPNLELLDPPRSCRSFFQRLNLLLDGGLSVSPVRPDVANWIKELEQAVGKVRVTSMAIGNLSVSEGALADIVVSGAADIRGELRKLAAGRRHVVGAATLEWKASDGDAVSCELTRNGANVTEAVSEEARQSLRDALSANRTVWGDGKPD